MALSGIEMLASALVKAMGVDPQPLIERGLGLATTMEQIALTVQTKVLLIESRMTRIEAQLVYLTALVERTQSDTIPAGETTSDLDLEVIPTERQLPKPNGHFS